MEVIDNFFADYERVRREAIALDYQGEINPVDGVLYPNINTTIPCRDEVEALTAGGFMFLRLSPLGVKAPHQVHTDITMGKKTLLIYLCEGEGGTSIVSHKETGMTENPVNDFELSVWQRDHDKYDAWHIIEQADIKPNRAVIIPSHLYHRAEPIEGFGVNVNDGRLVLTCFYD